MTARNPLWTPSDQRIRASRMHGFMTRIAERYGIDADWDSLHTWSVEHREHFWDEMLRYAGIQPYTPATRIVTGEGLLAARWFDGMTLNYAAHLLRFDDDADAIRFENERNHTARLSRRDLREHVARCAAALKADGVTKGDRVAGYLPNVPETVIAMLAAASLGAVWSSCSPDFGAGAVLDRFGQIEPTVLFCADGYTYNGKRFDLRERVAQILGQLAGVKRLVVVPYLDQQPANDWDAIAPGHADALATRSWTDYLRPRAAEAPGHAPELDFEPVPFDHPLFIMYSSGTTGAPKCIVHGHGGTLLQHMKEHMLHCDMQPHDHVFYFTTCGWMMWNWLVSALGSGAAIVLYDGNPAYPDTHRLWQMAERLKVSFFGASPKYLGACEKAGISPGKQHDLSALRAIASTGSPLSEELFEWVYREVKADLMLASISGGTDIISCFMLGNPILPVYAGQIQCCGLGMDVHAFNEFGEPVIGEKAELVCCSPFPSQPVGFWNDSDRAKYRAAYFEHKWTERQGLRDRGIEGSREEGTGNREPGTGAGQSKIENRKSKTSPVWRHGDFVEITEAGGIIVYGRSDATLNPGGVRIGTAEIYRIVEALPEVLDSVVVGRRTADDDVEICLFVVLREGEEIDALAATMRERIASGASKRHVPRHIRQVRAIPHTISGKKVELAIQQILHGEEVKNRDALANPEALDEYRNILQDGGTNDI